MRKVSQLLEGLGEEERWFSCEFFPPKTKQGLENLVGRAKRLSALGARFVSVTWGAGGSSASDSLNLAMRLASELKEQNVPIVLHLTCTNMSREILDQTLDKIADPDSGIDNILALRGDRPRNDYAESQSNSDFSWAVDLVRYIHKHYPGRFCVGVAAYPEGFTDSPTKVQDVDCDMRYLVEKVEAGAEFIVTQLFYDAEKYLSYQKRLRAQGGVMAKIPLIPGIMPVVSYNTLLRSAELSHASIPADVKVELTSIDVQDDEKVKAYGVNMVSKLVRTLEQSGHVRGFHFFTLNLEKSVSQIVQVTGLVNKAVTPSVVAETSTGQAAVWDDFTNGRYTDPNSAAFGQIDGYGPVVHGAIDGKPNPAWEPLQNDADVSKLFIRHITNEIAVTPFSDRPLSAETSLIQEELIELNSRPDIWTLASQPAAYEVKSTDKVLGWGPPDGTISQHAFVELLVSPQYWKDLKTKLEALSDFVYYAAGEKTDVDSNVSNSTRNVVTWGQWADSPAVESTIVCYDSFEPWRDEVFSVLRNWQRLYSTDSASYKVLGHAADNKVLVTIIYTKKTEPNGLWKLFGLA